MASTKKMVLNPSKKVKNKNIKAKIKVKEVQNTKQESDDDEDMDFDDLLSPEDKKLLQGIDEGSDDGTDVEVNSDGDDIDSTEIAAFLKQLGVAKHRPSSSGDEKVKKEKGDKQKNVVKTDDKVKIAEKNNSSKGVEIEKKVKTKDKTEKSNVVETEKKVKKKDKEEKSNVVETEKKGKKKDGVNISNVVETEKKMKKKDEGKQSSVVENPAVKAASKASTMKYLQTYKSRKYLLMKQGEMWREEKPEVVSTASDTEVASEAEKLAERLLADEVALYTKQRETTKRSDNHWLKTVLTSGTLTDKMAALTLLVQESPLHNLAGLDSLATMAGKKGRREAMMAVDTLRDLYLTGLLPDDRKLKQFNQHPFLSLSDLTNNNPDHRDKLLLMWHFEAVLKQKYAQFIKTLGEMSFDTLQATKEKAVATISRLLSSKPEQENTLLPMLVNKLGDPTIKSKTMYLLTKLVEEHPNMATIIVREVKQLLHRPNVSGRAQYYAICFLSQLRLSQKQAVLAAELISIYFFFFQAYLQKGEVDNKMMSALLTGVNRAYVYAKGEKEELHQQMNSIYKIIPQVAFHTGVQALMLLFQVTDPSANASDRFYMSLYRKLGDPALRKSSKQAIFMNLMFKSLKRDLVDRRIKAFIKRILQVYGQQPPQVICGILIILSQILKEKPALIDFKHIAKGTWEDDDAEEKFVDLPAPDEEGQDMEVGQAESDTEEQVNGTTKDEKDKIKSGKDSSTKPPPQEPEKKSEASTWVHRVNTWGKGKSADYDPLCRNPLYCRAETDLVWELQQLTRHYHPSVRLYSENILNGEPIDYDGDPLKDFTLIRFLDRFVYKNPKKQLEQGSSTVRHFRSKGPSGIQAIPVNSEAFLNMEEGEVPEEDKFFYKYFSEKAKRKKEVDDGDSDDGSVDDAEFDNFLSGYEKDADDDADEDELDLDFARDKKKSKGQSQDGDEDEPSDDDDDDDDLDMDDDDLGLSDDDLADAFAEEMAMMGGGGDDSGGEPSSGSEIDFGDMEMDEGGFEGFGSDFSEDGDDDDELKSMMKQSTKKRKKEPAFEMPGAKKKKRDKHDTQSLFASAEEFAHLLEEDTEQGKVSLGGADDVSNRDKSGLKQLKWEADRERGWAKGKYQGGGNKGRRPNFKKGGGGEFKKAGGGGGGAGGFKKGGKGGKSPSKGGKGGKPKHMGRKSR